LITPKKLFAEVLTPLSLIEQMLDKLPPQVWLDIRFKWCDPACGTGNFLIAIKKRLMKSLADIIKDPNDREKHILENMLYGVDLQSKNCVLTALRLDPLGKYDLNLECTNSLHFNFWDTKFDVITMNPPYQPPVKKTGGGSGSGNILWDKFVLLAFATIKRDGFLVAVHPPKWRKPEDTLFSEFKKYNLMYLEMHNKRDGIKILKASTPFDWYVVCISDYCGVTTVKDIRGHESVINLRDFLFLPNCDFDIVKKLIGPLDEQRNEILYSYTEYVHNKPYISKIKTDKHCHLCVHTTPKNGIRFFYSSERKMFFGVSKVIFGDGDTIQNVVIDENGEYGMTPHAMGIPILSKEQGVLLKKALESKEFNSLLQNALRWSQFAIDWRVFRQFHKNFWKHFL